jgi:hypothetical protein
MAGIVVGAVLAILCVAGIDYGNPADLGRLMTMWAMGILLPPLAGWLAQRLAKVAI